MPRSVLTIDNTERLAPAGFNDADQLEIVRRITRDAGSAYKVGPKDVRARDVQMLFADASTGAHSPALVRQGQISELINARPDQSPPDSGGSRRDFGPVSAPPRGRVEAQGGRGQSLARR
jgi:hypothetical protein